MIGDGAARIERVHLCDLLEELGPDAPTLCIGWETRQMAAHLVARDRSPMAMAGIVLPRLNPMTARREREALAEHSYPELVQMIRDGPPLLSPMGLPGVREALNVHEYFIHHEDVRRANGRGHRRLSPALRAALRLRLGILAPQLLRRVRSISVALAVSGEPVREVKQGSAGRVVLHGAAGELFLYLFNRREPARVRVSGDPQAIARLAATRLGI